MYTVTLSCPSSSQYFPLTVATPHQTVVHANGTFGILRKKKKKRENLQSCMYNLVLIMVLFNW